MPPPYCPRAPLHMGQTRFILKAFAALNLGHAIVLADYFQAANCFGYVIKGD